jgi:hypothetical protein
MLHPQLLPLHWNISANPFESLNIIFYFRRKMRSNMMSNQLTLSNQAAAKNVEYFLYILSYCHGKDTRIHISSLKEDIINKAKRGWKTE